MLQETAHDPEDADVLREPRDAGPEAAEAPHVQLDRHPRLARLVELADDLEVLELIHLRSDAAGPAGLGVDLEQRAKEREASLSVKRYEILDMEVTKMEEEYAQIRTQEYWLLCWC